MQRINHLAEVMIHTKTYTDETCQMLTRIMLQFLSVSLHLCKSLRYVVSLIDIFYRICHIFSFHISFMIDMGFCRLSGEIC